MIFSHAAALSVGFLLDLALGDPHRLPHPVRAIGRLISALEPPLRRIFPASPRGLRAAGVALAAIVVFVPTALCIALLGICALASPWIAFAVESVVCYQMLAARQLQRESMRVYDRLEHGTLDEARRAVAMIVGRDTDCLDEEDVTKAAVETVAENASDGVVAPMLFMAVGGAPLGVLYKAVNTMDSMVGYRNDRYRDFGWAAARLDDVLNFVPARLSALLMCLVAQPAGFDGKGALRIWKRDRAKHLSPNSAQTEAACAGALGIRLGGSHFYSGELVDKPAIGDATRRAEHRDIPRANRLMYATAWAALALCLPVAACLSLAAKGVL